jgi:ABC-type glutathione transport system ATPase component
MRDWGQAFLSSNAAGSGAYAVTSRREVRDVKRVIFDVAEDECLASGGESGSGKSTIANMILGIYPPSTGEIRYRGVEPPAQRRADRLQEGGNGTV